MATPDQIGTVYDVVIDTSGYMLEENSYRATIAPQLAPKVSQGAESLQDLVGETRIAYWSDWRGGMDDRQTKALNRYYRGQHMWALKQGEIGLTPFQESVFVPQGLPYRLSLAQPVRYAGRLVNNILYEQAVNSVRSVLCWYRPSVGSWEGAAAIHGEYVNDLAAFDGFLYAFGESNYYVACNESALMATSFSKYGEQYRLPTIYDDRLYVRGNVQPDVSTLTGTSHKLFALTPRTTSFAEVAALGSPDHPIRGMAVLAGALHCGKDDGLWTFQQNRAWKVMDIAPMSSSQAPNNPAMAPPFANMAEHQGWLYYQVYSQPFRYNGASIEVVYGDFATRIYGMRSIGELLFMYGMDNSKAGVWVMRDMGWHNLSYIHPPIYAVGQIENETHFMGYDTTAAVVSDRKIVWEDVKSLKPTKYQPTGKLMLPWADGNLPTWMKAWKDVQVHASFDTRQLTASGPRVELQYVPSELTVYPIDNTVWADQGQLDVVRSAVVQGYRLQRRASAEVWARASSDQLITPKVHLAGLTFTPKPTPGLQHNFQIRCEDNLELRDGSLETKTAVQMQSNLIQAGLSDKVRFFGPLSAPTEFRSATTGDTPSTAVWSADQAAKVRIGGDGETYVLSGVEVAFGIGFSEPFDMLYIKRAGGNEGNRVLRARVFLADASLPLGGSLLASTSEEVEVISDGTSTGGGGATLSQSGLIILRRPENWLPCTIEAGGNSTYLLVLYNIVPSSGFTIDCVRIGRWAQVKLTGIVAPDLEEITPRVGLQVVEV